MKHKISFPLMEAIIDSDINKVEIMLKNILDVNILINGLNKAIERNNTDIIKIFLKKGVPIPSLLFLNYKDISLENLRLLLEYGADINEVNNWGDGIIHNAIRSEREDIIKLLLQYGANINLENYDNGDTPLHQQSYTGTKKSIKILLDNGAIVDKTSKSGSTPFLKAVQNDNIDRVKILLDSGANIDAKVDGYNALLLAIYKKDIELVKLLLNKGIKTDLLAPSGQNIMSFALKHGNNDITNILQKYKVK